MSERVPWQESNLALIGSDLDHKIKEAAAEGEPAWEGMGEAVETKVWRIEQFKVVAWPEEKYGEFHTGDSYIVLNTFQNPGSEKFLHDLYIWIGSESSQDEYGTAAYKMVEADDFLGGTPVQHREVQGKESFKFKSYFKSPLTYLVGGVETGFEHVEPTKDDPNLYRVKGTENAMSLTQLTLSKSSLNTGDSFILYAGPDQVWVWHGSSANPDEKFRSNALGESMCTEGTVTVLTQGDGDEEDGDFWAFLGEGDIQDADDQDDTVEEFSPTLYRLSDDPDTPAEEVAKGEPVKIGFAGSKSMIAKSALNESDIFLLDSGWELFVWIGKEADRSEKLSAMAKADQFAKATGIRTQTVPISLLKSGYENSEFLSYFMEE